MRRYDYLKKNLGDVPKYSMSIRKKLFKERTIVPLSFFPEIFFELLLKKV